MWKKILVGLILLLMVIGGLIRFGVPYFAGQQITKLLTEADSASYSFLDIDMWHGDIEVQDIYLADTNGNVTDQPIFLQLDKINITGIDLWKAYRHKYLSIQEVNLGRGVIRAYIPSKDSTHKAEEKKRQDLPLSQLEINKIRIDSIAFRLKLNAENDSDAIAGVLRFQSDSIHIPLDKNGVLAHQNTEIKLSSIYLQPKNSVAYFMVDTLRFSYSVGKFVIQNFKMRQRIQESQYARHFGYDKDYIKLDFEKITVAGLPNDLESLQEGIHIPKIVVFAPQAYIYKDRRLPHPGNEKKFIIEALSEIELPIRVDSVQVIDGQLYFNENWRDDFVPGRIYLSDIQATLYNLNNKGPTEAGEWTGIDGKIKMFDRFNLDLDWKFDLRTKGRSFVLDIDIGPTQFATLNPFTENTVGARFSKGKLLGGRLYVEATKKSGAGTLDLYYSNLRVKFFNKQTHHTNFIEWAEGGLANLAVVNNNLPNKNPRQGVVYAEPLLDRAVFGYVMRLFFSGFKDIALTSKNAEKVAQRGMEYIPMPEKAKKRLERHQ